MRVQFLRFTVRMWALEFRSQGLMIECFDAEGLGFWWCRDQVVLYFSREKIPV